MSACNLSLANFASVVVGRPCPRGRLAAAMCLGLALAAQGLTSQAAAQSLAIRGARIYTGEGPAVENGVVLIREGRIAAIGTDVDIPVEAKVIDASGKVIMPGIVEVHTSEPMSQANERAENVAFLSVVDSIDPSKEYFDEARRNGVTTIAVMPGNSTMIGGRGAIMKVSGGYVNDMLLKRDLGVKFSLSPLTGSNRMSHYSRLRRELRRAKDALDGQSPAKEAEAEPAADAETPAGDDPPAETDGATPAATPEAAGDAAETTRRIRESLTGVLRGEELAYFYCDTAMDVSQALQLVKEFGLKPVLVLGRDCDKAAASLAEAKTPVVLPAELVFWRTNPRTREDEKVNLPQIFRDAGAAYVFGVSDNPSSTTLGGHYHWYQAATAVKYGMSPEDALRAITLEPAKILGIDSLVGSLEVGKDADLLVLSGEPFSVSTWVDTTVINGQIAYERDKDTKLKRLLQPSEEDL